MKIPWHWFLRLFLIVVSACVLAALQTSLWFLIFGMFPAPMLWLVPLVYVSVSRRLWEATLFAYLLTLVNAAFTVLPFEAFLIFSLALMLILVLIRERVYWGGPTYFMLMVGVASALSPLLFWCVSRWFDSNPIFIPHVLDWLLSGLLTMLVSLPLYRLFQWFDRLAETEPGMEVRIGPK